MITLKETTIKTKNRERVIIISVNSTKTTQKKKKTDDITLIEIQQFQSIERGSKCGLEPKNKTTFISFQDNGTLPNTNSPNNIFEISSNNSE